jgi:hypothetical protein
MTSESRAQRLVDEFEEAAYLEGGSNSIRHGIAAVLRHLSDSCAQYGDEESFYAIPARTLEDIAEDLTDPTLLENVMAGDVTAARQLLHQAGFTDERGQWLPQYQPPDEIQS